MSELLDTNILTVIAAVGDAIRDSSYSFIRLALQISALLVLFVIAKEAYNLMSGNKQFDLLWWIRPLLMGFIIAGWTSLEGGSVPFMVRRVFGRFEYGAKARFTGKLHEVDMLKQKKTAALEAKHKELLESRAQMEAAKKAQESTSDDGISMNPSEWMESIKQSFEDAKEQFKNHLKLLVLDISNFFDKILEFIGNFIWRIALYSTLMIKEISIAFLFIFGPLSFAISVYDPWRDAWASWLMRFISFQFYGFVAYHIMTASLMIISYGVQNDIKVLSQPGFPEAFSFSAMYTLFGYLVGAFALKIVPEVVSWVVPTNTSQAATQFTSGVSGAITGAAVTTATYAGAKARNALSSSPSSSSPSPSQPSPSAAAGGRPSQISGMGGGGASGSSLPPSPSSHDK